MNGKAFTAVNLPVLSPESLKQKVLERQNERVFLRSVSQTCLTGYNIRHDTISAAVDERILIKFGIFNTY
jgi:hypothetical protein